MSETNPSDSFVGESVAPIIDGLIARSREAYAEGLVRDAAVLHAEAARLAPADGAIHRATARLFREAGDNPRAEHHYAAASRLDPDDAMLLAELGEFYAGAGRARDALATLARAAASDPGAEPGREAAADLRRAGFSGDPDADGELREDDAGSLAAELAPTTPRDLHPHHHEGVTLRRLGRPERSHWGVLPTLRGLEAIRGFCVSAAAIREVQLHLNGRLIYRAAPSGELRLAHDPDHPGRSKYMFNIWIDFSDVVRGLHQLECRCLDGEGRVHSESRQVAVAAALREEDHPGSDALVTLSPLDRRSPDAQVASRPSMARPSRRSPFARPPQTVLVQRVDQLGDMVISVAAIRRLRQIFPAARLIGLVSTANAELAATLGLFDEIVAVEFPDDPAEQRRTMPVERQRALRERLAPYRFDMAIDLSENASSRPLMLLSGAPVLIGFPGHDMPGMAIEVDGFTHDRMNRGEIVPHASKLVGLVEWLAAQLGSAFAPVPRIADDAERLRRYSVGAGERFVLLHGGARLAFSRWPHFVQLASLILSRTPLSVVLLADQPPAEGSLSADLASSERFRLIEGRLAFDDLDALAASCAVMVGNDSGPKHLASLRGAKVVSLHMARNNWSEWGQEGDGYIISRKLPCAGCLIQHNPEECGRNFACIREITAEEVFDAVARLI